MAGLVVQASLAAPSAAPAGSAAGPLGRAPGGRDAAV